jgi:hypothetical protein
MGATKDLVGLNIGKLTVIEKTDKRKSGSVIWLCKCDCGNYKELRTYHITHQIVKSCGCLSKGENNPSWKGYKEIPGKQLRRIRVDAKNRGIEFDVTNEEIWDLFLKQDRKCALTGQPIKMVRLGKDKCGNASLDRIDSSKGYTIDNVQWVDKKINMLKNNYSVDKFIAMCKAIVEYEQKI